jgi:K+-transporting ATPase ATPase A chain
MQRLDNYLDVLLMIVVLMVVTVLVKPLGTYMAKVYEGERTFLSAVMTRLENLIFRIAGIRSDEDMDWKQYALAVLIFNGLGILILFGILRLQEVLPLNPERFPGFSWDLALNTAVSFTTNTNWQAYSGESTATYVAQMLGLSVQNFFSAATGMSILIGLIRSFARNSAQSVGNFWVDMTRSVLYILLPISFVVALFLVSQGVIQNFSPYVQSSLLQPLKEGGGKIIYEQTIPMGPVASQEAIKMLGSNGGGFFNANSSHPFENPNPLTNFVEIILILLIAGSLTYTFGRMIGDTRQGWAIYATMFLIFVLALGTMYWAELTGNPVVKAMGVQGPYMEGKETRFGVGESVLFATSTTAVSCGAVNSMHDSLTPIGGMIPMFLIVSGEVVFGGVGSGLYTMLAFAIIAVFVAGLMIGRTPEYLGKKIEISEMWMSVVIVLSPGVLVLILTSIALVIPAGLSSILNPGPHGLSEVLYGFASTSNNNGSAFAGLNSNTHFYNLTMSFAMLIGRFVPAVAVLAMAGSLIKKKYIPSSAGTLPTHRSSFIFWLALVVLIVGVLAFFPLFAMGPIVEQLIMQGTP